MTRKEKFAESISVSSMLVLFVTDEIMVTESEPQGLRVIVSDPLDMDSVLVVVGALTDGIIAYAGRLGLLS